MRELYVIAHDMRSAFNVGSLFRTAEGLGVKKIFLTGYTPYPGSDDDKRLPHLSAKLDAQIDKTALGATKTQPWEYIENIDDVIDDLTKKGVQVVALEQTGRAVAITEFKAPDKVALVLGTEVTGLPKEVLDIIGAHIEIPMYGNKESFNVVQAAAMALFELRFH